MVPSLAEPTILIVPQSVVEDLDEIRAIVREAGFLPLHEIVVKRINSSCYLGRGKLEEVKRIIEDNDVKKICVYDELRPRQITCLLRELKVEVLDKVLLILNIFAQHAGSKEANLQIELARLRHELPLIRDWVRRAKLKELPGFLGPGGYAIDAYYRHAKQRIAKLTRELNELRCRRELERSRRRFAGLIHIAVAGYTNSGKTTLFNALTKLDKPTGTEMFTTLAPKSYGVTMCGTKIVFVDTVGFIKNIPYDIIESFNAVLEEISDSDAVLLVLDSSEDIKRIVSKLISSIEIFRKIGVVGKPLLVVMNKIDLVRDREELIEKIRVVSEVVNSEYGDVIDVVPVSALKGYGLNGVKKAICRCVELLRKILSITSSYSGSDIEKRAIRGSQHM